jgi:acylphosphatase
MPEDLILRHVVAHGRVQGVGYRAAVQVEAVRLGLTGWTRNRLDGTVESLICGRAEVVARFLEWAHAGPPAARVTRIDSTPHEGPPAEDFRILPTE